MNGRLEIRLDECLEYFIFILALSIMINFLGRKYWVFLH
jgi:hypothetical protein